uniref:Rho guanine nucleotide exchange factor 26 n=1 Tax=Neogobius melanostomus TaxID=47308 RepID=A0A8C6WH67_9GOBI
MDFGNDVDLSNNNITPLWKRRSDHCRSPEISRNSKPRPVSYHMNGVMTTDFPVEDKCSFTLSQPAERILMTPASNTAVLKHVLNKPSKKTRIVRSISIGHFSSGRFSLPKFRSEDNKSASRLSKSSVTESHHSSSSSASPCPSVSPPPLIVLSTNSPAALKMGTQQLIPKGLACEVRQSKGEALSMVETGAYFSTVGQRQEEGAGDSPGTLRRGLRSTSYRKAVVSGVDEADSVSLDPKSLHLSKPASKGLNKDKSPSSTSPTIVICLSKMCFSEEELYQNYQEKALHNDSDEDADSREPKPDNNIVVQYKPIRTSWSQLSVVKKSGLSERLSQEERKRQEAIFEVISSEHSYLHSLEILIRMFKCSAELSEAMTKTEHHHLFSNITDVCEASKKFFNELEERHQQNILIQDICDIVCKHAQSNFDPYITYCSNEVYQQRTLQRLVSKNPAFKEVLTRIESHPDCRNLPMISFLILPMQRITRLPLLMDTICQKTPKDSAQYEECKKALQAVSKVVRKCNEGTRTMERTEMMYTINSQLEFKIKPFPLVSSSRWMVKRAELTAFAEDSGIFLKRTSRQQVYFFLFNDVLIVTRKKSEDSYTVIDYALRDEIWVGSCQPEDLNLSPVRSTASMLSSKQGNTNHLFRLTFRSNHSGEKVLMTLGTDSLGGDPDVHSKQPDELSLQVADVVLISQTVDGWYEGERLRDGERGWFLVECTQPITCQATIERNMQRMDRLQGLETNV